MRFFLLPSRACHSQNSSLFLRRSGMARCSPLAGGCNLIMEKSLLESDYSDIIYIYNTYRFVCNILYCIIYSVFCI